MGDYLDEPANTSDLLTRLRDPSGFVRAAAADALVAPDTALTCDEIAALITMLNDPFIDARISAAHALCENEVEEAVPMLIEAMNDSSMVVRSFASDALGRIRDVRALDALCAALIDDPSEPVRMEAAFGLECLGDRRAVPSLVQALSDPEPRPRDFAAQALIRLCDESSIAPLIELLGVADEPTRMEVIRILGALPDPRVLEVLLHLQSHGTVVDRAAAGSALTRLSGCSDL